MRASQAFNFGEFCAIASRHETDFTEFGVVVKQGNGEGSTYTFKDNSSTVLGIAHLDTVQRESRATLLHLGKERAIICPRLDDRLGVYIITKLLPRLGIACDWLLTTGEEVGASSAELFQTDKAYNWAFSFDRRGTDAVLYQFEHKALRRKLRKAGFRVGQGTFSDLSCLDIGCSGINFGCGYYDEHSIHSYALLNETFYMVDKFVSFWKRHAAERLPFKESSRYETMSSWTRSRVPYHYGLSGYDYTQSVSAYDQQEEYMTGKQGQYLDWWLEQQEDGKTDAEIVENLADRAQYGDNGQ